MKELVQLLLILVIFCGQPLLLKSEEESSYYSPLLRPGHFQVIPIGGLFDRNEVEEESAFKKAIQQLNDDYGILPRSKFEGKIEHGETGNSVLAAKQVCGMLESGVAAIFGPQNHESASHVQSICDAFEIPHIETKWDYRIRKENYLINLHPHPASLNRAYNDLVEAFGWESYAIIYEDEEGLFKLQDLIKASVPPKRQALLRQLSPGNDHRRLFREILRETKIRNIILDCKDEKIYHVLKQAQQIGLMTYKYSYILTSLDLHTIDIDDFKFSEANITALRLVDPEKPHVQAVLRQWQGSGSPSSQAARGQDSRRSGQTSLTVPDPVTTPMMTTRTALLYDAVHLLGKALHVLDSSQRIEIKRLQCDQTETWQHGYSIINYMKMVQFQGLTGLIQFNTTGFRTDVHFDVIQLRDKNGLKKIGAWDSKFVSKFNWTKFESSVTREEVDAMDIRNRTFVVSTIMNNPFCMLARSEQPLVGNARYEGFVVDLLQKLSALLGFKYTVKPVNDGNYGSKNKSNGQWNGMMQEVLDGTADIAVADLTINKERQEAVDFTMPFMNLGISILYKSPSAKPPSLFSFLSPFSLNVWIYMGFAFFGVSIILYILARVTPIEWDVNHPCVTNPDELVNQFTLLNSFWFTIGSIMQQGSDVAPKLSPTEWVQAYPCHGQGKNNADQSVVYLNEVTFVNSLWICMASLFKQKADIPLKAVSTRMIAGIWWFFTLIMVSSYTANLATFLIVQDLDETIKSLADLAKQDKVKYGCVRTGSTASFFRDSPFELNQKIWKNIKKNELSHGVLVNNNKEGIEKVKRDDGRYAFFMESTVIEYTIERDCGLAQVGGLLDSKGYGIALPKGSKYLQAFSSGVLRLQELGVLDDLKRKWWKEEHKENVCVPGTDGDAVKPLKLANVGGVFVVLVCGCLFAIFLAFLEFLVKSRESKPPGEPYWDHFMSELRFALSCRGNTKPVRKKSSKSSLNTADIGMGNNVNVMGVNQGVNHGPGMDLALDSMQMAGVRRNTPNNMNPYLDLPGPVDSYGFPQLGLPSPMGGLSPQGIMDKDGFT